MRVKKQIIIGAIIVVAFIIVGWTLIIRKPTKGIIVEENIEDLPQKSSVSLDTYMPIVKDTVWVYEDSKVPYKPIIAWIDFIKNNVIQVRFKQGDEVTAKIFIEEEEAIYEVATVKNAVIKQDYTTLRQYNNIVIKLPIETGTSWVLGDGAVRTITDTSKNYETSLGNQKGVEITTIHDEYTLVEVFAEKVGLFSISYQTKENADTLELSKIETNKPQEEEVSLYLVNKNDGQIEEIHETVGVLTNEEPKHFLTDLLKKAPSDDYLVGISNGAIINNLFLDEEDDCLYVDMSEAFIDPIYNKAEQEKVLMSLVNTLGNYYNATYVVMTVKGEAYPLNSPLKDSKGRIKVKG